MGAMLARGILALCERAGYQAKVAMKSSANETDVRSLQRRAEQAIRAAKPRDYIVRLLEQLVAIADAESEAARFAHRHLAELRLEDSPWRAALHLRRVLAQDAADDVAHALMGLCHALLGNFRCAISSYRRAVALAPKNPWYNHNLGHLLDVTLGASHDALPYLRRAHRLEPSQDEVSASLAHCLGRIGALDEALTLARALVRKNPREADLRALLTWLEQGARAGRDATTPGLLSTVTPSVVSAHTNDARSSATESAREIERVLTQSMARAGHGPAEIERARRLWHDYAEAARKVAGRPAAYAAAVEYALVRLDGRELRQREVAERYGVSVSALQARYAAVRATLGLAPKDPRYARAASERAPDEERK